MTREGGPDYLLIFSVLGLLALGIIMVYSASAVKAQILYDDGFFFLRRQAAGMLLGLIGMYVCYKIDYQYWATLAVPLFYVTLILLALVLVPGLGREAQGAQRWLGVGAFAFNPAELMKLALVLFLARYAVKKGPKMAQAGSLVVPVILMATVFLLIMQQPDLGTAAAIVLCGGVMLFAGGMRLGQLVLAGLVAVPVLAWYVFSEDYRRERFLAFLDPWADPRGSGYHIIQALYALGSGRLFGLGLGGSRQKFFYLPEQHTDFIFAVIGEELGFIGTAFVITLFIIFAWRGLVVALRAPCAFGGLLALGSTMMIVLQAIINIGVISSVLPITGIPLPFLSYGGSSLLFMLAGVGILLNVSRQAV